MTQYIKLTDGTVLVDFSGLNCTVSHTGSNPLAVIPTVADPVIKETSQAIIDLGLLSERYQLTFDLKDGVGSLDYTISATTNHEKITYLMKRGHLVDLTFYWGTGTDRVKMESFSIAEQPGKKDFMPGCSVTLVRSGLNVYPVG